MRGAWGRPSARSRSGARSSSTWSSRTTTLARAESVAEKLGEPDRFGAAQIDASDNAAIVALAQRDERRRDPQRRRPALQPPDLRGGARGSLHVSRHGDDAFRAASGAPVRGDRREARRPAVRGRGVLADGGPARARRRRRRAGPLRRLRPLRRRPPVLGDRRGGRARRVEHRRRGLRVRAVLLHLVDDRGVPQPAGDLGARARLVHDRAVLRARGVRLSRKASALSSA